MNDDETYWWEGGRLDASPMTVYYLVSALCGMFAFLIPALMPRIADSYFYEGDAIVAFYLIVYLYLQIITGLQQRRNPHARRSQVYFWLFALLPIWSAPAALGIVRLIERFATLAGLA